MLAQGKDTFSKERHENGVAKAPSGISQQVFELIPQANDEVALQISFAIRFQITNVACQLCTGHQQGQSPAYMPLQSTAYTGSLEGIGTKQDWQRERCGRIFKDKYHP